MLSIRVEKMAEPWHRGHSGDCDRATPPQVEQCTTGVTADSNHGGSTTNTAHSQRGWTIKLGLALASSLALLTSAALSAQASPNPELPFAHQADEAGLTHQQALTMQKSVDSYLKQVGGSQVAVNEIRLDDRGSSLLLPLPGEKKVRDLEASPSTIQDSGCSYTYFCVYSGINWSGALWRWSDCNNHLMPTRGTGSWINYQTTGTRVKFLDAYGVRWMDAGAPSADDVADFSWVLSTKPC
jgi:hypothetical protein